MEETLIRWHKTTNEIVQKPTEKNKEYTPYIKVEYVEKIENNKDGTMTISHEEIKTNLTKKINETAKTLKIENTESMLEELIKSKGI